MDRRGGNGSEGNPPNSHLPPWPVPSRPCRRPPPNRHPARGSARQAQTAPHPAVKGNRRRDRRPPRVCWCGLKTIDSVGGLSHRAAVRRGGERGSGSGRRHHSRAREMKGGRSPLRPMASFPLRRRVRSSTNSLDGHSPDCSGAHSLSDRGRVHSSRWQANASQRADGGNRASFA